MTLITEMGAIAIFLLLFAALTDLIARILRLREAAKRRAERQKKHDQK